VIDESQRYRDWVNRYVTAWNSNDPEDIGALFSAGARYSTSPYEQPWMGRDSIIQEWLNHRDQPGDATFDFDVLICNPDLGIVRGRTYYRSTGQTYHNLWEIRMDGNLCREFVEWWMEDED
jgi:hypothetical protein